MAARFINDDIASTGHFGLNSGKHLFCDDSRENIGEHVPIFGFIVDPLMTFGFRGDRFSCDHVSGVFFVCKYFFNGTFAPDVLPSGRGYSLFLKNPLNPNDACSLKIGCKNQLYDSGFI